MNKLINKAQELYALQSRGYDDDRAVKEFCKILKALAKAAPDPKVVVYVEGGNVQGCESNCQNLKVIMIDRDNLSDEADPESAEEELLKTSEDCIYSVY